jgi:hypothetical protein
MAAEPIEIVLTHPSSEFSKLYRYAQYADKHPICIVIPVVPGFRKAVVIAAALQFTVRLDPGQPDPTLLPELMECLDLYLHDRTVRHPIEFFHSSLYALYHGAKITLWDIHGKSRGCNPLQDECAACEYVRHCDGFFKSPDTGYCCNGVKEILAKLSEAASELKTM